MDERASDPSAGGERERQQWTAILRREVGAVLGQSRPVFATTLAAMPRTLTIQIEDCDDETYSRVANAVWYAVNASGVNFSVAPDDDANRESLNDDWREQEPWT